MHNGRLIVALLLSMVLATLPWAGEARAAIYYVDQNHPNASDNNPGTSENFPWRTLHRAVDGVPSREAGGGAGTFTPVVAGDIVFVKNGLYRDITAAPAVEQEVKYNPANSGTPTGPIAFRAFTPPSAPRHTPVVSRTLHSVPGLNDPVIGSIGRNYIVWDGFVLDAGTNASVFRATGVVLENLAINPGAVPFLLNNYDGIRLEAVTNTIVRYNVIRNVYYLDDANHNASCIKLYDATNTLVHNNDISSCNSGIFDKEGGVNNTYELNYIHDIISDAILFQGFDSSRCVDAAVAPRCFVENITIRHNIIFNSGWTGINLDLADPETDRNFKIYNNTFHNVHLGIRVAGVLPGIEIYNSIITITPNATNSDNSHLTFASTIGGPGGPPADLVSNFSDFRSTVAPLARFYPFEYASMESLSQWRARGFDVNSLTDDPLFVGPLAPGLPAVSAFRLQATSTLRNAGRVRSGGVFTSTPIHMGAFTTDTMLIGIPTGPPDTIPPNTPSNLQTF